MASEIKIVGKNNTSVKVTPKQELVVTITQDGVPVSSSNPLQVSGGGGGGGGGDASAENQVTGNISLATIATNTNISKNTGIVDSNTTRVTLATDGPVVTSIGNVADSSANSDTGSFSILSFIKRGLQNWTTLLNRTPVLGQSLSSTSTPVVIASDQIQDTYIIGQSGQTALNQNILLSTAGIGVIDALGFRSVAIQIIPTGTVTSGVITFEASNDPTFATANTVSIWLYDDNNQTANPIITISNTTGVTRSLSGPIKYRYLRARISTAIGGGGSLQALTTLRQTAYTPHVFVVTQSNGTILNTTTRILVTTRRTYSASFSVTVASAATDIVEIIGSTASVQITKIFISGIATAISAINLALVRKSSIATGGTSSTITPINYEITDAASTAVIKAYTVNPTQGTTVGRLRTFQIQLGTATSYGESIEFDFGVTGKPFILASATQTLCLSNLNASVPTDTILSVSIEYTEI